jgi:hypothetical protein
VAQLSHLVLRKYQVRISVYPLDVLTEISSVSSVPAGKRWDNIGHNRFFHIISNSSSAIFLSFDVVKSMKFRKVKGKVIPVLN